MTMHRLTINVQDETKNALDALKKDRDVTYTEHVYRAVRLFNHILAYQNEGATFHIREKDGKDRQVIIMF